MSDDLRQHDLDDVALNRFWNELVRPSGDPGAEPADLSGELPETVRQLRAISKAPPPEAARERLLRKLSVQFGADFNRSENADTSTWPAARFGQNGQADHPQAQMIGQAPTYKTSVRQWRYAQIAAAAILLLVLGIAIGLFWPDDPERPKSIPAAIPPSPIATPAPISVETVLEFAIPVDALPTGEGISSGFAHFTIPPGTRSTWEPACCDGPMVEFLMEGSYTVRAEAAIRVVRVDGSVEEIPAGTELTLGPGDSLISRNETRVEGANTGSESVELLNWVLIEPGNFDGHSLPGWIAHAADVQGSIIGLTGSITVTLRQYTLLPDATLAVPDGGQRFVILAPKNVEGTPSATSFGRKSDGSLRNLGKSAQSIYVLTLEQAMPPNDSPLAGIATP